LSATVKRRLRLRDEGCEEPGMLCVVILGGGTIRAESSFVSPAIKGRREMSKDEPLKPGDFPLESDKARVKTQKGENVASTESEQKADDIAHRLNDQAQREEDDRWSA
jgi:hypothetical protein